MPKDEPNYLDPELGPTQYVAGLVPKVKASLAPLSIASTTSTSVNVLSLQLELQVTAFTTGPTKFFDRMKLESSSATKGIVGNSLTNSEAEAKKSHEKN